MSPSHSESTPAVAKAAIALVSLFALACFALAVGRCDSWDDLVFFGMLSVIAANVARSLAIRDRWAWTACCWIAAIATINFGLLGTAIGVWLAVEASGFGQGNLEVTQAKVSFWAAWMALLVVIPGVVGYALTRPAARDWFATAPSA